MHTTVLAMILRSSQKLRLSTYQVSSSFPVIVGVASPAHLPGAGDARLDGTVQAAVLAVVAEQFLLHDGPGADHAHVPGEYVDELGEFVEARSPQEFPDPGDAGILLEFETLFPFRSGGRVPRKDLLQSAIRVHVHGAEFKTAEFLAGGGDAPMPIEHRTAVLDLDEQGDQEHERQGGDQNQGRKRQVEHPLAA